MTWPTRDLVSHRAAATPQRAALVDAAEGRTWTYRDLDRAVDALAADLRGPVGVLLDTRVAFVVLVHAAVRRGSVLVPLNVDLPAGTLADQARRADLETLVCGRETEAVAADVAPEGCRVATVDAPATDRVDGVGDWATEPTGDAAGAVDPAALDPGDDAVVLFTSGTTGRPKGVRLTLENLVASAAASAFRLGVGPDDRWLCCLPMYHMGGLAPALRCPLYGTTLVVQRGFDADRTATVLAEHSVTGVSLVPTQVRRLLDAGWEPTDALRTVLVGGAPCPPAVTERALARGVPVHPTYGATEAASQVATARPAEVREDPETVGAPLVVTDVTVLSEGEPVGPGETGELVVDGPTVTPGYLDGDATAAATTPHGLRTGDVGYRDADGRLFVLGRVDDAVTTGGETVHPGTVADALRAHPDVAEAAVVGLPDEKWGERVAALVVSESADTDPDPAAPEVRAWCRDRVADYAVPKTVGFADAVPRTASGTVDREAVRQRLSGTDR